MQQNPEENQTNFNQDIKRLAVVIVIVAVAGWLLFKIDAASQNNNPNQANNQNMEKKITAATAYTITDPALQIKPPTEEEIAKYNAEAENKTIVIETTKGKIKAKLLPKDAPYTVASFMKLIDKGLYNGLIFHRVIDGFMIQGGDPSGNGSGGPGYKSVDEFNPAVSRESKEQYPKGTLAMANSGPNTNGSQFFIMAGDNYPLQYDYTVFGKVVAGQDVADAISKAATYQGAETDTKKKDMPLAPVKIKKVYLETL